MEIYGSVRSRTRRVLWAAEEAGVDYVFIPVNIADGDTRTPGYLSMNPNGKVPVMVDGELTLFESAAIGLHIAALAPSSGLLPEVGTADWSTVMQWMFWTCTELEQALWSMGKHRFALPEEYRIEEMMRTANWEFARAAKVLAGAVKDREFLVGERWTVADVFAAQTLLWARSFMIPLGSRELEAYLDRAVARPAFRRSANPRTG
jgi:glutathione S-transferase